MRARTRGLVFAMLVLGAATVWSGGASESAAGSAGYGKYLAGEGVIIPPDAIHVDSTIASVDYRYPRPEGDIGVTLYAGHRQISTAGQEEVIQIGIQGGQSPIADLPPMNLAFVIDKSGSMNAGDKMGWVKDAFDIFVEQVRDTDFVSLVVFSNEAEVLFDSTRMDSRDKRLGFKNAVQEVMPGGGTNLRAGLEVGYQQVMANFRKEYTNRVLFLTDGVGDSAGILEMAEMYREMGINVSTIGVGGDFDVNLMTELGKRGGGSSRFISDREEMEKTFGSELDRMVVPVAYDLNMTLEFGTEVEVLNTWGYRYKVLGNTIRYHQATLHHRDYETIMAQIRILPTSHTGPAELARFSLSYRTGEDQLVEMGPFPLTVEMVDGLTPVAGFSNGMVLQSGTMMHFAQNLVTIGELYYSCRDEIEAVNRLRDELWQKSRQEEKEVSYEELTSDEIQRIDASVSAKMRRAMDLTTDTKKELYNARTRLDEEGFDDEIGIVDAYIRILGVELKMEDEGITSASRDVELAPPVGDRTVHDHLANLFREMSLDLAAKEKGVLAVSGFTASDGRELGLLQLLNETAMVDLGRIDTFAIVERGRLAKVLEEQELALSDLVDTATAIDVGKLLAASHIITGTVIEMSSSVVVFGRIINVETAEVESVAQVIIPKDEDLRSLL